MKDRRALLIAAFAAVYTVWGSTYLAIHYAIQTIPPFLMAGTRFLVAGAIMYAWGALSGGERPRALHWRNTAIIGLLLLLGGNGGVSWSEQSVPSGVAALLVAIVPLWLVLLDWLRPGGQRPSLGVGVGITIGLIGMLVLVGVGSLRGGNGVNPWGALVLVVASALWAGGSLFARSAELPSQILTTAMEMLAGGAGLVLTSAITGELARFDVHAVTRTSVLALLYLVVFGSIVGFTAYSWLLKNAAPAAVGTYAYVNPIVAVFLGWLIAGETVTPRELAGAAIILVAVGIITTRRAAGAPAPKRAR
jgi:drug/metabolite transporter (DMT)-like permease